MLNVIWPLFIIISYMYAIINGNVEKINNSVEYIYKNNTKVEFIIDLNYIVSDEQYY